MPTKAEVYRAADKLLAGGERPSLRKVTAMLPRGGSPRVVCKHLAAWREERNYKPRLDLKDLPERLQGQVSDFAREVWESARGQAAADWERERVAADGVRLAEAEDREHLLGQLEASQAEAAGLTARVEAASAEAARLQTRLTKVENQLDRFRAEEFWDRVMREVAELLAERGALTPEQILSGLKARTVRGATLHREPLTPGVLRKKMEVRISFGKYFTAEPEGRYARRPA